MISRKHIPGLNRQRRQRLRLLLPGIMGLLVAVVLVSGCSWTSSLFGSGEPAAESGAQTGAKTAEEEVASPPEQEPTAAQEDASAKSDSLVPRPQRSRPTQPEPAPAPAAAEESTTESPQPAESTKAPEPPQTTKPPQAGDKAEPEEEAEPAPIKAKGAVPIEPEVKAKVQERPQAAEQSKVYYATTEDLHAAIQKAIDAEKFLGYTDPFDAFPVLDGVDTMSAAFIPVDSPDHKVFYHAFFQPTKPFHKRVYGYTVIDMITNQDYGYFDGNADGTFEQETLDPKIVLDDYIRASGGETLPTAPEE